MNCPLCHSDNAADAHCCRSCGAALSARSSENSANLSDALPAGTLLAGAYMIEGVLGQGGFGITYRCHDQMLDRRVAVKEFFPSRCRRHNAEVAPSRGLSNADFREARAQFLAEARTLARCHHVGIVGVHAAFEANQTAYMVMELLSGKSLAQLLIARGGRMIEAEAVAIIERIGDALQFVHELNLLHRDIKPDNIIVCDDGRVMLIDFGTARETIQGQVQGHTVVVTPGYAPLEQYARQARRGAFTDIYSLAATLYHLLTGQMPPAASDRAMGVQLRPIREFNPQVSASVARATESALQLEIAKRPQSVREFLDLLHAPADESINGISPALQSVIKRPDLLHSEDAEVKALFSSKRAVPPAVALFSDALQEGQTQMGNLLPDANQDASKPPLNPSPVALFADSQQDHQTLLGNLLPPAPTQPVQLAPTRDFVANADASVPSQLSVAGGSVNFQRPSGDDASTKKLERMFAGLIIFSVLVVLFGSMGQIGQQRSATPPDIQPVGQSSSLADGSPGFNSSQEKLKRQTAMRAWDALPILPLGSTEILPSSAQPKQSGTSNPNPNYRVRDGAIGFSPDGERLAYIAKEAVLRVLSLPNRRVVRSLQLDKNTTSEQTLFSPDHETIAVTQTSKLDEANHRQSINRVDVWNLRSGKRLGTFVTDSTEGVLWCKAVLNDGQLVLQVLPDKDSRVKTLLWNTKTKELGKLPLPNLTSWWRGALSPDGKEFVVSSEFGSRDAYILRWIDWNTGKQRAEYKTQLTLSDYDQKFGGEFPNIGRTGMNSDTPLEVQSVNYSFNGSYGGSRNEAAISVFDSKAHEIGSLIIGGRFDGINPLGFSISPDGKWLATQGNLPYSPWGNLLWNRETGQKIRLQSSSGRLLECGFSLDGKQLYGVFDEDNQFRFVTWEVGAKTTAPFANLQKTSFQPGGMRFNPFLPSAQSGDLTAMPVKSSVEIWRQNGTLVNTLDVGNSSVATMKFSLNRKLLAIRKFDSSIQVWNVNEGTLIGQLNAAQSANQGARNASVSDKVSSDMVFSPDNKFFVCERSGSDSPVVELWSLEGEPRRLTALVLRESVNALAFSPDSKTLACGGEKGLVQLYDVATHQLQTQLRIAGKVLDIVGTPKNWVVVGTEQTTIYRLSSNSNSPLQQVSQVKIPLQSRSSGLLSLQWAVSADGQLLATANMGARIQIFDLKTGFTLQSLDTNQSDRCMGLEFSADGSQLTSLGSSLDDRLLSITTWSRTKTP